MDALTTPSQRELAQLQGYSLSEKLYDGSRTIVYRGFQNHDQRPVIVKFLKDEFPSFKELVQFSNQFMIAKDLNLPTIVKPIALVPYGTSSALIMEDYGGLDLKQFLKNKSHCQQDPNENINDGKSNQFNSKLGKTLPDLILFFQIAIQVTEALEGLCQANIIHKDIKPSNILIHPESHQVKLIDFSIASLLPRESQDIRNPSVLEGTLSYLSPEQTGRMNRGIDYRSDFYAFGVTCYELLTGQLPFNAEDPMEIVHGHLARQPIAPHDLLNGTLPTAVSAIVLKLMAKNAEDRYQSAFGLKHDLEKCLAQLKETGQISPFALGQGDVSDRFLIPEKLYGRQSEVAHLLAAFNRVSQGNTELMLIAGSSGIGKTAVVNEVHKPIAHQQGYFIQGKYDQLQRNVPLSAFIQAFRGLIKLLLSESDAQLEQWQHQIFKVLGRNGQVLIEVIPELEGLIGPQPPAAELSAIAAENRFNRLMQKFVQVFTGPQHPLVIFLDDLQWADAASLKLLRQLMQDDGHLLIIGAYRDNEVGAGHPLILTLEEIREARAALASKNILSEEMLAQTTLSERTDYESKDYDRTDSERTDSEENKTQIDINITANINLLVFSPLSQQDINHLVADTLHSTLAFAAPLADLIYQKTHGNPFFSAQYLTSLQAENNITFNTTTRQWQYDLPQINATAPSDDVLEFMQLRLQKLPAGTQTSLQFAACIGAQFDLATLAIAAQQPVETMATNLWCAMQAGLVIPTSDSYKAFTANDIATLAAVNPTYRFFHDRIQQAAYGLITDPQKAAIHRTIGERLWQNSSPEQQEKQLFNIVNHLNQSTRLVENVENETSLTTDYLIELNLRAGRKTKAATAYAAAYEYFSSGMSWLPANHWQTHHDLTLTLHNEAAEMAYLAGNLVAMQQHIDQVLQQATVFLDKARAYEIQIQATIGQNHFLQGIEIALNTLAQLGVNIPRQPEPTDIQQILQTTAQNIRQQLNQQPISTLIELPEMEDSQSLVIIRLLTKAVSAAYIAKPEVLPLLVCTGIERCLKFGNSPLSAFLYGWYGVILCGLTEEMHPAEMHQSHQMGHQMGRLAVSLLEKLPAREIQARVISLVYFLLNPWKAHIKESLTPLQKTYQSGLENGDTEYAAWAISVYCHYAYLAGNNLENLTTKIARYRSSVSELQQEAAFNCLSIYQQVTLNLLGHSASPTQLEGEAYSEAATLPIQMAANDLSGMAYVHINKGILAYLFAKPQAAQESFDKALNYLPGVSSSQWMAALCFYDALACLAISPPLMSRVSNHQQKLKTWARLSPGNHLHRWHLIEAECCRLDADKAKAIDHYDQAIALASANGFIQEEALANELAAQFYLMWGKGRVAQTYMIDAYYAYSRWGAAAKIADLEKRYPQLLEATLKKKQQGLSSTDTILAYAHTQTTTTTSSGLDEVIDLTTLLQTAQVLSSEIELEKLLGALLDAVIQNAGADKCALLMPQENSASADRSTDSAANSAADKSLKTAKEPQWVIEAYSALGQPRILLQSKAIKPGELMPVLLINQVRHTCEPAIIFNAAVHASLSVDPYVLRHQPKSVLCAPIINQGKLVAILYLENNLTIGAFTDNRVEVLNLICTQAAISLENARLYYQAQQALKELKTSHMQLVQSEKMSALGNLVAGVAHEINNPINFLKGNLKPALNYVQDLLGVLDLVAEEESREIILEEMEAINLEFIRKDLPNLLHSMTFGISRIQDISTSLRTFSRADKDYKTAFNLHEGLDSTLLILKHRLQIDDSTHRPPIQVVKHYAALPDIHCFAGQLNQVFMNLIANAIEAISEAYSQDALHGTPHGVSQNSKQPLTDAREASAGKIAITTTLVNEQTVKIAIADNGPGMEDTVKARVFEHLFTTKPVGKGTGLGLAISYAIVVEKHGGTLTVSSEPGKGTEFVITLPVSDRPVSDRPISDRLAENN